MAQLAGESSYTPKDCGFDPWSGHIARLQAESPVKVHTRGNQSMFISNIDVNVPLSLHFSLSKINKHILGWGFKNIFLMTTVNTIATQYE